MFSTEREVACFQVTELLLTAHQESRRPPATALRACMVDADPVLISARLLPSCGNLGMDFIFLSLIVPHLEKGTELSLMGYWKSQGSHLCEVMEEPGVSLNCSWFF